MNTYMQLNIVFCSIVVYLSCLGEITFFFFTSISCRCVSCTQCGATTPGLRCDWQNNYTQCAPCASLTSCPVCLVDYSEGTIIVQCRQCDRSVALLKNCHGRDVDP